MSESAKWYVVHTYSGYENAVKEQLLRGAPPQNILISFDGKPPQSLEEHARRLEKQKRKKRNHRTK